METFALTPCALASRLLYSLSNIILLVSLSLSLSLCIEKHVLLFMISRPVSEATILTFYVTIFT